MHDKSHLLSITKSLHLGIIFCDENRTDLYQVFSRSYLLH